MREGKDIKVALGAIVLTFVLIVGFSWFFGRVEKGPQEMARIEGVSVTSGEDDWGEIPINSGIVTKDFSLKNETGEIITLKKLATSCMCTEAKVRVGGKETKVYGMEHPGDKNPAINLEIPSGEQFEVGVNFDPAAHGPQGIGPFERSVWLTFSDPGGVEEVKFTGTVTK